MAIAELDALEPLALSRSHRVVLVDDDPNVLVALRRVLRREPYDLRSTVHPELALRWIGEGGVSLVVLDQRMPELCGTELAGRVRRLSPGTIRVLLTAYSGNTTVRHGLSRDVQWLISKPWNDAALRLTLRQLLQDREIHPRGPGPVPGSFWKILSRALKGAARGAGWTLGFLGSTDASGVLPR